MSKNAVQVDPPQDCGDCARLQDFRREHSQREPDWHNAPVPSFGDRGGSLLIVGLAPGLRGANRTGRPFTGDFAGDLLYATLNEFGLSRGDYAASPDDGLQLVNCLITNAVRCVPPQNKPLPAEIRTCQPYLTQTIRKMANIKAMVTLGRIAHNSVLRTLGLRLAAYPFAHGARHDVEFEGRSISVFDSYHCSRYNTNTGVLTPKMFRSVFAAVSKSINA